MKKLTVPFILAVLSLIILAAPSVLCVGIGGSGVTIRIKVGDTARYDFVLLHTGSIPQEVTYEIMQCPSFAEVVKVTTSKGDFPITIEPGEKVICTILVHADASGEGELKIWFKGRNLEGNLGTDVIGTWNLVASPDVETTNKQLTLQDIGVSKPAAPQPPKVLIDLLSPQYLVIWVPVVGAIGAYGALRRFSR